MLKEILIDDCAYENGGTQCDCRLHWWCEELRPFGNHYVRIEKIIVGQSRLGICRDCSIALNKWGRLNV